MPPELTTPRLTLRPFTPNDLVEAYDVLEGHPDVWKYDPGYQRTREERDVIILKYASANDAKGEGTLAIIHRESGMLMGYVGLQLYILPREPLSTPEVELYYKLGRHWWGKGYAAEACRAMLDYAFKTMRLARIVTVTHEENSHSIRLMERLGMKIEPAPPAWAGELIGTLENPHRPHPAGD